MKRQRSMLRSAAVLVSAVQGSPVYQHRVPATRRHVPYTRHAGEHIVAAAEQPSDNEFKERHDDTLWHIVGDASKEHPDHVFRSLLETQKERTSNKNSLRHRALTPSKVHINTHEDVVHESVPDFDKILQNHSDVFNITTNTEYDVEDTTANDTSTVIYTQSEPQNNTNSSTSAANNTLLQDNEDSNINTTANSNTTILPSHHPVRIRAFLADVAGGGEHLSSDDRNSLLQDMVRPALLSWSAALRVDPVQGNLTVDPHQLTDQETCGPAGIMVPVDHITAGVPDTDMILYIQLAFVPPSPEEQSSSSSLADHVLNDTSTVVIQSNKQQEEDADEAQQDPTSAEETLLPSMDDANATWANVSATTVAPKLACEGDYLASASFCSTDQFDRPTAATLRICVGPDFFEPRNLQRNMLVVQHELGHALGFNAVSLAHFRRPDGTPITKRNRRGEIPLTEIACTGPVGTRRANVTLPSTELLQFRHVRGGVRVAQVVTPAVAQVARNHFDCQELTGAELESGGDGCLGDHWERRLFQTDLMNPVVETVNFNPRISTITLAYFADSGWYQVDLARASTAGSWGRGAGCEFVEETCIDANGEVPPKFAQYFCNDPPSLDLGYSEDIHGCTQDMTRKAICTMGQYEEELPLEYQYFPATLGANIGGSDPFMDYCPVYSGYSNGLCSDPHNDAVIRVNQLERFGRRNSRCLKGRMNFNTKTAFCLPIACVVEDRTLRIQIEGVWEICRKKDELLPLGRTGSFVTCPDPVRTCPTFFCYRDCLGTSGRCDFEAGECVCNSTACVSAQEAQDATNYAFFDSTPRETAPAIPEPGSPLADIYFKNERGLRQEKGPSFFRSWEFPLALGGFVALLGAVFLFRRRLKAAPITDDNRPQDDPDNVARAPSANKDKMIATVVVDLRMSDVSLQDRVDPLREHRASETDLSLTDTEGVASHVSNLSIVEEPDLPSAAEDEEDLDTKPRAIMRRRRGGR